MSAPGRWALVIFLAGGCAGAGRRGASTASATSAPGAGASQAAPAAAGGTFVYVGLASGEVAAFKLDVVSGVLGRRGGGSGGRAPSSLAFSAEREALIAVDEGGGQAISLSINMKSGALSPAGRAPTSVPQPSGATIDTTGKYILAAHRGNGRVSVVAIKPGGGLDAIDSFASGAGATAVAVHPSNQVAFVSNFRAGTISQFNFNTGTGMLTPKAGPPLVLPAGAGPTRFAVHPTGRWVYLINETTDSISVHVYDTDLKGLSPISEQIVPTLPQGAARGKSRPADLAVRHDGRFLYATNRGHDSVAIFSIEAGGTLKLVGHEPTGGHGSGAVAIDPSGAVLLVANEGSKSLSLFHIDESAGTLGGERQIALPAAPLSVLIARL